MRRTSERCWIAGTMHCSQVVGLGSARMGGCATAPAVRRRRGACARHCSGGVATPFPGSQVPAPLTRRRRWRRPGSPPAGAAAPRASGRRRSPRPGSARGPRASRRTGPAGGVAAAAVGTEKARHARSGVDGGGWGLSRGGSPAAPTWLLGKTSAKSMRAARARASGTTSFTSSDSSRSVASAGAAR
jgi:hypothetical protein